MNKHFYSSFENEQELLKAILKLHIKDDNFDLDPMFHKGGFYKEILKPNNYGDLNGNKYNVKVMDATNLDFADNSINNMILDPPFMIANRTNQHNYTGSNFGFYKSLDELIKDYINLIKEAYRVLKNKGILVFKCQDFTDNKTFMIHCIVYNIAFQLDFYPKDLVILVNKKNKVYNPNLNQRHFRKVHTYFWVFEKNVRKKNNARIN